MLLKGCNSSPSLSLTSSLIGFDINGFSSGDLVLFCSCGGNEGEFSSCEGECTVTTGKGLSFVSCSDSDDEFN